MDKPHVYINIVTYNSLPYLEFCLASLKQQTFKNFTILIIDNASRDNTLEFLAANYPEIPMIKNSRNLGFAAGHNQGMEKISDFPSPLPSPQRGEGGKKYIFILNPDVILTPTYLEETVKIMEQEPRAGGITGQLLRYELAKAEAAPYSPRNPGVSQVENGKTIGAPLTRELQFMDIIDSEGLEILRTLQVRERNAGKILKSDPNLRITSELSEYLPLTPLLNKEGSRGGLHSDHSDRLTVWGISGACALYRLKALENAKIPLINPRNPPLSAQSASPSEYFDEDFFCYQEDIDLSWRLRILGWKFLFTPLATAFHHRAIGRDLPHTKRNPLINYWSYRNHFYILLKNERGIDFIFHAPWIIAYEGAKFLYYLCTQPRVLACLWDFCKNIPSMLKKRKMLMAKSKI